MSQIGARVAQRSRRAATTMTTSLYIRDKAVIDVVPYKARRTVLRLDVGPFAVLYFVIYWAIWRWGVRDGWVVLVALPSVLACHLLVFLSTQWSIRFMCLVSQRKVASIDSAENVRVVPAKHCGSEQLLPLRRRSLGSRTAGRFSGAREGARSGQQHEQVDPVLGSGGALELAGQMFSLPELWFVFQQTKFVYTTANGKKGFQRLEYPTDGSFRAYLGCRGLPDKAAIAVAAERWGPNVLDIPMPAFLTLFAEHAVAPFFVFQILCVTLWSLDEYWYYALFTLFMLVLFEAMLCLQRQKNLEMLRSMRREPTLVYVLRLGRWWRVSSEGVTPGEVVSLVAKPPTVASALRETHRRRAQQQQQQEHLGFPGGVRGGGRIGSLAGLEIMSSDHAPGRGIEGTGDEEALVPFDLLLMRGSCVVNEAMLTGESVPQAKTSLATSGGGEDARFQMEDGTDSPQRNHIIFGGTKVLQFVDGDQGGVGFNSGSDGDGDARAQGASGDDAADSPALPTPPDKGCPCVVLRTGFETSQGQLMKTILFATKRVAAGSDWETGIFIFILLVFAAFASAFVLVEGLADETHNPYKLVLHCIMILTSVIPPELPIELSLAVINSLTALTQSLIFCTEPFRIPLAGKVDVCCFDKTGTLTSDNLVMKGVAGALDAIDDARPEAVEPATKVMSAVELGEMPTRILAGCHSLVTLNGALVGDAVEVATLKGLGWACLRGGLVVPRASTRAARVTAVTGTRGKISSSGSAGGAKSPVASAQRTGGPDPTLRPLQIVHVWPFDPTLRRMCTAIRLASDVSGAAGGVSFLRRGATGEGSGTRLWIVSKGAPEALEPLLSDAPANYRSTFLHHMGQGSRVLALGYRAVDSKTDVDAFRRMTRASAERGLKFGGFLVLGCPLKPDARYVVRELRESSHGVAMITGDGALTAADVARQVGMIDHPPSRTLVLSMVHEEVAGNLEGTGVRPGSVKVGPISAENGVESPVAGASLHWVPLTAGASGGKNAVVGRGSNSGQGSAKSSTDGFGGGRRGAGDEREGIPFDIRSLEALAGSHALCVTGDVLSHVSSMTLAKIKVATGAVRVGTNTTNALVFSGVGGSTMTPSPLSSLCSNVAVFARVSPAQKELIVGELSAAGRTTLMCGDGTNDVGALRRAHVGVSIVNSPELEKRLEGFLDQEKERVEQEGGGGGAGKKRKTQRVSEAKRSRMLATREIEEQDLDPALVKLGDASIASPFTAKTTSVGCVLAVIRQGRCTLVTTLQVYKILALNCLTSAYMLSALYLKGVKQGDGQMTALGLVISAFFYCASRSQPLRRLSAARPPAGVFGAQACSSVLGQFAVHLASLVAVAWLCEEHINPEDPSVMPDGPFRPNTLNSSIFLLSWIMQVNTFTANYTGHPFMQSLRENRPMWYLVVAAYGALLVVASGAAPLLESWLQLAPFPEGFREPLLAILAFNTGSVFLVEAVTGWCSRRVGGGKSVARKATSRAGKRLKK